MISRRLSGPGHPRQVRGMIFFICDPVRIGFADPRRIGLTQSRPVRYQNFVGASSLAPPRSYPSLRSDTTLFRLSAFASELARYQTKKPSWLRPVGFVTP